MNSTSPKAEFPSTYHKLTGSIPLVMEQPRTLLNERDPQLLRRLKHGLIVLASDRTRDILHSAPRSAIDVIDERKLFTLALESSGQRGSKGTHESITANSNAC